MLFFLEGRKPEKTLGARREPTTNSAQIWPHWGEALLSCKNAWNDLQRTHLQMRFYSGTYLLLTLQMRHYSANKTVYFNLARVPGGLNVEGEKNSSRFDRFGSQLRRFHLQSPPTHFTKDEYFEKLRLNLSSSLLVAKSKLWSPCCSVIPLFLFSELFFKGGL